MSESIPKRTTKRAGKSKRAPRAAFVVTVAAAAVVASACGSSSSGAGGSGGGEDECPLEEPTPGDPCTGGLACTYTYEDCSIDYSCGTYDEQWADNSPSCDPPPPGCGEGLGCVEGETCQGEDVGCGPEPLSCEDGVWVDYSTSCNPPASCPIEVPIEGETCKGDEGGPPVDCSYQMETACGPTEVDAVCVSTDGPTIWTFFPPPCEPEAPDCEGYTNASLCQADVTCRWLVPGCAEPPSAFVSGCYPVADCDATSCALDQACGTVVVDPCFGEECEACAADAQICLPSEASLESR